MEVDHDSPTPVWRQVAAILRSEIESGQYPVKLPGELRLSQDLGVARQTVRKAIALLRDEGLVTVSPAKGVYIVKP